MKKTSAHRPQLFAVRLWKEGTEYRGSVREVVSGAFGGFRDWSELIAFMVERLEEGDSAQVERKGGLSWPDKDETP